MPSVHWNKATEKWRAELRVAGKLYHLGVYKHESSATAAVAAAREALARGEQMDEYVARIRPKTKGAERQSSTPGECPSRPGSPESADVFPAGK